MRLKQLMVGAAFVLGALTLAGGASSATLYAFSFSGDGVSGSGEFDVTGGPGDYTVTGITGTADGSSITGLSSYAGADQELFPAGPTFADFAGISFSNTAGVSFNFTNFPGSGPVTANYLAISTTDPSGQGCCDISIDMSVTAVPEPATWGLMFLGVGLMGAGLRTIRIHKGVLA